MPQGLPEANPHTPSEPSPSQAKRGGPPDSSERSGLLRDALILQLKLILEGLKDILLGPVSLVAVAADLISRTPTERRLFYRALRAGERFERFLNLYGALPEYTQKNSPDRRDPTVDGVLGWGEGHVRKLISERREGYANRAPMKTKAAAPPSEAGQDPRSEGGPTDKP
jgi:hypothetical protein